MPIDTYISTRDRYIAELRASTDPTGTRVDHAIGDLESRLKAIIPPWHGRGFPTEGKINLSSVDDSQLGLSVLNGLVYGAGDTAVVVTTPALARHWIADHNRWWNHSDDIPQSLAAALRSETFWTYAMFDDARAAPYGEVIVAPRKAAVQTVVLLATFAQDLPFDAGPSDLLVAVVYPDRVFVARQKLAASLRPVPACEVQLKGTRVQSRSALKAFQASNAKSRADFDTSEHLDEKADREYRACFAAHLREQPYFDAVRKQAQSLVDLLH